MSELLDLQDAADYLSVSRRTVYREVQRGKLRMVKVGGSTRFRKSELDRYIKASERDTAA